MLKIYGSMLCKDCVACCAALDEAGISYEFCDFAKDLANLKTFLTLRDQLPEFHNIRGTEQIGIPCIVQTDGSVTLDYQSLLTAQLEHDAEQ